MEQQMDHPILSPASSSHIREVCSHSTELNKKRKLPSEHTDLTSPISKQKLESHQAMELAESSENITNSDFTNNARSAATSTSCSSSSNEAISSSSVGSSIEFDSGASAGNFVYNCKKELFKELEALHDPVISELVKNSMEGCDDADDLDSVPYSDGLDEFATRPTLGQPVQDGRGGSIQPTIDQEFEQYFSKLML